MRNAIGALLLMTGVVGCGDGSGGDAPPRPIAVGPALVGVYDATVTDGADETSSLALIRVFQAGKLDLDLPLAPLDELAVSGPLDDDRALHGILHRGGRRVIVTGTAHAAVVGDHYRITGTATGADERLAFDLERPVTPHAGSEASQTSIAIAFSESPAGTGCPSSGVSRITSFEGSSGTCFIAPIVEVPDRDGSEVLDGSCWLSPRGRFFYEAQYRNPHDRIGITQLPVALIGTLRETPGGWRGQGRYAHLGIDGAVDVSGEWTIGVPDCGDRVVGPGESCDDGNVVGGDGCSAACQNERVTTCRTHDQCCVADDPSNPSAFELEGTYDVTCESCGQTVASLTAATRRRFTITLPVGAPYEVALDGRFDTGGEAALEGTLYGSDFTVRLGGSAEFSARPELDEIRLTYSEDERPDEPATSATLRRPHGTRFAAATVPLRLTLTPTPEGDEHGDADVLVAIDRTGVGSLTGGPMRLAGGLTGEVTDGRCMLAPSGRIDCRAGYRYARTVPPFSEPPSVSLIFSGPTSGLPALEGAGHYTTEAFPLSGGGAWQTTPIAGH